MYNNNNTSINNIIISPKFKVKASIKNKKKVYRHQKKVN